MKKEYKIIGVCQVFNEIERENLVRFFTYNKKYVEDWIIYDDCSTDGTFEYCLENARHVIRGTKNDFKNELSHRQSMLDEALKLGADFILWLDADEVLTNTSHKKLQELCAYCEEKSIDGLKMKELNLWRSSTWRRTDSLYDDGWFVRLWRVTPGIRYEKTDSGLHKSGYPTTLKTIEDTNDIAVLHYGFANELNLAFKYLTYKSHGQSGYVMLDRLVNEDIRTLSKVDKEKIPEGLWIDDEPMPEKYDRFAIAKYVEAHRSDVERPKYSICCLIYKSVGWLKFVHESVLKYTDMSDKEFYFIANDPTPEVVEYLERHHIPFHFWKNTEEQKKEWHINNVYRAYNFGVHVARGDFVCLINSDMTFSPTWFEELIKSYNGRNCVASRLVESGKLRTGKHGIEMNFGYSHETYQEMDFLNYADGIRKSETHDEGLFMPLFIRKSHFESIGGYPEGNIKSDSDIFHPIIAKKGDDLISGDNVLMRKLKTAGVSHQTSFGSIVYHFQSGELDEESDQEAKEDMPEIAICNDITTGINGEKVLWDFLIEGIAGAYSLDKRVVGEFGDFEYKAREYITKNKPNTRVIIQNASFIGTVDRNIFTIMFLQDDLRAMGKTSLQQEENLKNADIIVTNSIQTALSYSEYDQKIISVGINTELFKPRDKENIRKKYGFDKNQKIGIFVGSFNEVKGWDSVVDCFKKNPDIHFIAVTKYDEEFEMPNVSVFKKVSQETLSELHGCADFFILGSPVETQCLAALEAGLCGLPVIMPLTGIFKDFSQSERDELGIFTSDLANGLKKLLEKEYVNTRKVLLEKELDIGSSLKKWNTLIETVFQEKKISALKGLDCNIDKPSGMTVLLKVGFFFRRNVLRYVGLEYFDFKKLTSIRGIRGIVLEFLVRSNGLVLIKKILGKELTKKMGKILGF